MKTFLITLTLLAFAVTGFGQSKTSDDELIPLGKAAGLEWFMTNKLVEKTKRGTYLVATMADYKQGQIIIYNELDCSDMTVRIIASEMYEDGKVVAKLKDVGKWVDVDGTAAKFADIVCEKPKLKLIPTRLTE